MIPAELYARVSSKDQEQGYSIAAQRKLLIEYAYGHGFEIIREFVDVETAKTVGRKQFGEMVRFFKQNKTCRVLLVEKTDRLYRNFKDYVKLEELDIEVHLPKEARNPGRDPGAVDSFVHSGQPATRRCGEEAARGHGAAIGVSA